MPEEEKAKLIPQKEVKKDEKGLPPEAETLEVPLGSEIEPVKLPEIKPVDKTKTSNIEDDLGVHIVTKVQANDLTDGGATTLHKHDHGGLDGLADKDHSAYIAKDGTTTITANIPLNSKKLTGVLDPTANQDAATKKYVDDNAGTPSYSATAGQVIRVDDPIMIADDNSTTITHLKWFNGGVSSGTPGWTTIEKSNEIVAQSFVLEGTGTAEITGFRLKIGGQNSPGNWRVSIQGDNGGQPDESNIAVTPGTLTSGDASQNAPTWTKIDFFESATITRGTKYWLVITSFAPEDNTNYYNIHYQFPSVYSGQGTAKKNWAGEWSTVSSITYLFELYGSTATGQAYIADARNASTVDTFIGFAETAVDGGGTASIQYILIYTNFSGLSEGSLYYLDDENITPSEDTNEAWAGIKVSAGTVSLVVGRAITATDLNIRSNNQ